MIKLIKKFFGSLFITIVVAVIWGTIIGTATKSTGEGFLEGFSYICYLSFFTFAAMWVLVAFKNLFVLGLKWMGQT